MLTSVEALWGGASSLLQVEGPEEKKGLTQVGPNLAGKLGPYMLILPTLNNSKKCSRMCPAIDRARRRQAAKLPQVLLAEIKKETRRGILAGGGERGALPHKAALLGEPSQSQ